MFKYRKAYSDMLVYLKEIDYGLCVLVRVVAAIVFMGWAMSNMFLIIPVGFVYAIAMLIPGAVEVDILFRATWIIFQFSIPLFFFVVQNLDRLIEIRKEYF